MKQIDKDRKELQRLVESYGKEDVMKYVNHLDEGNASPLEEAKAVSKKAVAAYQQRIGKSLSYAELPILETLFYQVFGYGYNCHKKETEAKEQDDLRKRYPNAKVWVDKDGASHLDGETAKQLYADIQARHGQK